MLQYESMLATKAEGVSRIRLVQRVGRGAAANLVGQAINLFSQLVQVPLLLTMWGTDRYGEWLTLSSIVAYLSLLDFGIQTYATNRMTRCRATGDYEEYARILQSAWALDLALAAVGAALAIPALFLLPFDKWLQLHFTGHSVASVTACLLALQTIAALPLGLLTGIYRTVDEYPREQLTIVARQAFVLIATIATASAGGGPAAVAAAQVGAIMLPTLYAWRDLKRRHPEAPIGFSRASISMALSFLHPSLLFLVLQLCGAAVFQGSILMVGHMFGSAAVATYASLRTLSNLSQMGNNAVRNALWPEVSAMDATGDHHGLRQIHSLLTKVSMAIWLCATVVLYFEGADVVRIWSKGRIPFNPGVMHGVLLLSGSYTFWATSSMLLSASNHHRPMAWLNAVSSAAGLGLGWISATVWGLPGLVFGLAAADIALMSLAVPQMACRGIAQPFARFLSDILARGLLAALPVVAVAFVLARRLPVGPGLARVFLFSAVTGLCGLASFLSIWLKPPERQRMARLALRAVGR